MCQVGGPRCPSSLRTKMSAITEALNTYNPDDLYDQLAKRAELQALQVEYDGTPTGQSELQKLIDQAHEEGNDTQASVLELRKQVAKAQRDAFMTAKKAARAVAEEQGTETSGEGRDSVEYREYEAALAARIESEEFKTLLSDRDEKREILVDLKDQREAQKAHIETLELVANGKKHPVTEKLPTEAEMIAAQDSLDSENEKLRALTDARLDAHYAYHISNHQLEQYKDQTAQLVAAMNEIAGDPGIPFTGERLGNCVEVAQYDSGTREWLEERTGGIGGSDVGSMLKLDPEYGESNYNEFLTSKTEPISEEEVAAQAEANANFSGPTGRGNAWEPTIVRMYQEKNPDICVMYSKASWAHKDAPHYKANVDGLLSSDGVNPDGILEIKTASDITQWVKTSETGVQTLVIPVGYRAQVLWYLHQTGFKYADFAVMVDDHQYLERRIYADEPIDPDSYEETGKEQYGPMDMAMSRIDRIWNEEVVSRRNGTFVAREPKSGFESAHLAPRIERQARNMAAWTNKSTEECRQYLRGYAAYKKQAAARGERVMTRDAYVIEGLRQGGPQNWTKDRVYVDIETSGMTPSTGEVIEIGMKRVNPQGEVTFEYTERYGVRDERTLDIPNVGTGMVEVHRIQPDDVRGKRSFRSPEVQSIMNQHLNDPNAVIVAHNDNFERNWFNQNVDGFQKAHSLETTRRYKAMREGRIEDPIPTQDTMWTSRYLVSHTPNNKLATFTTGHGIAYENAHAADADTDMTHRAELAFAEKFMSAPQGLRWNPDGDYDEDSAYIG